MGIDMDHTDPVLSDPKAGRTSHDSISAVGDLCRISESVYLSSELMPKAPEA